MMRNVLAPAAIVAAASLLGACAADTVPGAQTSRAAAPQSTTTEGSSTPPATPTPTQTASAEPAATVPVYWIGTTPYGPRLYREFREVTGEPLSAALGAAVGRAEDGSPVSPQDPDYRSAWPSGTSASGRVDGDVITVDLGGDPQGSLRERPADMTKRQARLAVEQLVHTAQGVVQDRLPVQFLLYGERTDQVLGVPTSEPVAEGDPISTLALVQVTTPEHGATVTGSFVAEGIASSFEATVPWQIRKGDEVVLEGFTTAEGWMDNLYPWAAEPIDVSGLEPGEYTFAAMTSDPSGGAEGNGPYEDTKLIIVE